MTGFVSNNGAARRRVAPLFLCAQTRFIKLPHLTGFGNCGGTNCNKIQKTALIFYTIVRQTDIIHTTLIRMAVEESISALMRR